MATISSLGIGSGVLTSDLLEKLVNIERAPTEARLNIRKADVETRISEFGKLQSAVTALRLPARTLGQPDAMKILSATSSGAAVAATVDGTKAQKGQYSIDIIDLAQSHSIATGELADKDVTSLGTGKMTIKIGSVTKAIDITSANSTLSGVASEINKAKIGVNASVVYTGTGYRMVMSSEKAGAANAIDISINDDDGGHLDASGLSQLTFTAATKNLTQTVEAKDASLSVNGILLSRATNSINDVIDGVTLNLTAKTSGSPITLKVGQDTKSVADRVDEFVTKFNEFQTLIADLTKFDPSTKKGGVFLGDTSVRSISSQFKTTLSQVVPGLEGSKLRTLSEAGITTNAQTGQLQFNRVKFIEQLEANPDDMVALFAEQGRTSDSQVEFLTGSINSKAGKYDVNVTQLATQGKSAGNLALGASTVIDSDNDGLTFKVDDETTVTINMTAGTYTQAELVQELKSQLNANSALKAAGRTLSVELDASNQLVFSSGTFGSKSKVSITSVDTNTAATLGLSVASGTAGVDVAGTINGKAATGAGQVLSAATGDNSTGISVRINGGATGDRGEINYIQGVGDRSVDLINGFLAEKGIITVKNDLYKKQMDAIASERVKLDFRVESVRKRLSAQFTSADALVGQLKNILSFLEGQFKSLSGNNSN